MVVSSTDLAWAAGIIDGEGTVRLNHGLRNTNRTEIFTPIIAVNNTDIRMVVKLKEMFGGSIHVSGGKYPYQYKGAIRRRKVTHMWTVCADAALATAESLKPYLVCKKEQAEKLLLFYKMKRQRGGKMNAHGIVDPALKTANDEKLKHQRKLFEELKAMHHEGEYTI